MSKSLKISINMQKFKQDMEAEVDKLRKATRPAAQAGAQIVYERAKQLAPVSEGAHIFQIEGRKYGPFPPGTLRDSIYQAFSKDRSAADVSVYHVSWNADKAPYGAMVEVGTSRAPAKSFIARAVVETRAQVREAIKQRYIEEVAKA